MIGLALAYAGAFFCLLLVKNKHIMDLQDAQKLGQRLIITGEVHQDYNRTVMLADDYRTYKTGVGIDKKLSQFVVREDDTLFAQRVRMTKSITPAVLSSVEKPFNKVSRNDRVRKNIKVRLTDRTPVIEKMIKRFFGSARKKSRGLDFFLKTRFVDLTFIDPNAWVVIEWDAPETEKDIIIPRPFEVKAEQARNFYAENDDVKWLFVRQCIKYRSVNKNNALNPASPLPLLGTGLKMDSGYIVPGTPNPNELKKDGYRYTLYDEDYTIVYEQICPELFRLEQTPIDSAFQELIVLGKDTYIRSFYQPKIGYAPVIRVGYKRDEVTDGRTFVSPWHDALCYVEKTLKTVSEMDLTMCLHVFPQKIQYVQKCPGLTREKSCNKGKLKTGANCTACNGTGYKLHTTAQDAILLPMPEDAEAKDIINLDNLLVYKAPPIETVTFQNEYIQQLERQIHQAVYNSQVFVKKQSNATSYGAGGSPTQTATENDNNMQSVYDTLEPFTEKISEVYADIATTFAILAGENVDDVEITHVFPSDFKLKTSDVLLSDREKASKSGAPSFLLETIDDDLANISYAGDQMALTKYRVKRKFYPFSGKTADEVNIALSSQFVPEETKVLYLNFENIFKEIEREDPGFWVLTDTNTQYQIVMKKVAEFIEKLKAANPSFDIDAFREDRPPGSVGETDEEEQDESDWATDEENPGSDKPGEEAAK